MNTDLLPLLPLPRLPLGSLRLPIFFLFDPAFCLFFPTAEPGPRLTLGQNVKNKTILNLNVLAKTEGEKIMLVLLKFIYVSVTIK